AADTQAISGSLDITGGTPQFTIEFFNNGQNGCDSHGNGEGRTYIGFAQTSDGTFNTTLSAGSFAAADVLTATATDGDGNTSEFSLCYSATSTTVQPTFSIQNVTAAEGNAGEADFVFTVTKTGATAQDSAVDFLTVDG